MASKLIIEPLIGINEVMSILGVKRGFVYEAIKKLGLPYYRINSRNIKFKKSEVSEWVEQRRQVS